VEAGVSTAALALSGIGGGAGVASGGGDESLHAELTIRRRLRRRRVRCTRRKIRPPKVPMPRLASFATARVLEWLVLQARLWEPVRTPVGEERLPIGRDQVR
jgi:hypothetical protein